MINKFIIMKNKNLVMHQFVYYKYCLGYIHGNKTQYDVVKMPF